MPLLLPMDGGAGGRHEGKFGLVPAHAAGGGAVGELGGGDVGWVGEKDGDYGVYFWFRRCCGCGCGLG